MADAYPFIAEAPVATTTVCGCGCGQSATHADTDLDVTDTLPAFESLFVDMEGDWGWTLIECVGDMPTPEERRYNARAA